MQFIDLDPTVRVNLRKAAEQSVLLMAFEHPHPSFSDKNRHLLSAALRVQENRFSDTLCGNDLFDEVIGHHFFALSDEIVATRRLVAQRRRANANFTARAKRKEFA